MFTWEELEALRRESGFMVEEAEGFTINEYANQFGVARDTARAEIEKLISAGKLTRGQRHIIDPSGRTRLVNCYAVVPQ